MSELRRRLVHLTGTAFPGAYALDVVSYRQFRLALLAALVVVAGLEFVRLVIGYQHWIYDELTREYEADNVAGYALFFAGSVLAAFLFQPTLAVAAVLMLSVGDPISGVLGSADASAAKAAGVLAAMFLVCFLVALPLVLPAFGTVEGVVVAVAGALGATFADGVKPVIAGYVIDDNFSIPPLAGGAMWVVVQLL